MSGSLATIALAIVGLKWRARRAVRADDILLRHFGGAPVFDQRGSARSTDGALEHDDLHG
jgi:hypothetical protein